MKVSSFIYSFVLLLLMLGCKPSDQPVEATVTETELSDQTPSDELRAVMRVPLKIDMGEFFVSTGKKSEDLLLENVGTDTLRIFKIMPDCDCTEAFVSDTIIAPGHNTKLTVSLDLSEFVPAEIEKQFVIFSNNDENQYVRVSLVGTRK